MQPPSGNYTSPSTLLSPTAAPASIWAPAAWPQAVTAAATTTVATTDAAEPQPNWVLDGPYLAELASANDSLKQRPLPGGWVSLGTCNPMHTPLQVNMRGHHASCLI